VAGSRPRIIVVGGGVIGCSIARELAASGCSVLLLERDRVGCEASSAAAGILNPQIEAEGVSPFFELGVDSLRLYPDYVGSLKEETGIEAAFFGRGTLLVDMTREDEASSRQLCRWQQEAGLPVEAVTPREVEGLEAGLGGSTLGGLFFPRGSQVDPAALTRALAVSAKKLGVDLRERSPVTGFKEAKGRIAGVVTAGGETHEADQVILAAGAWSSTLIPFLKMKVFPVRGQILALESDRPPRNHVIYTRRAYLVPRPDGRVLIGSTSETVGFRKGVTPRAVLKLTASALSLDPSLEDATLAATWSGLRPATEDGLPLLGEVRPGLVAATGHHRNGILLAPVTAVLVAELIVHGKTARPLDPFSPLREPPSGKIETAS